MILDFRLLPSLLLLVVLSSSASSYQIGAVLPLPELVQSGRFHLPAAEFPDETKVVVFYYSASWCGPCKQVGAALSLAYEDLVSHAPGLELITYSVDHSPRARADYLRATRYEWPAISPTVIDEKPWLSVIPGGTPQFQAFAVDGSELIALTEPGDTNTILEASLKFLAAN